MAVVVLNMARGHDASYPFKTTGTAEGPVITGQYGASNYLSAVEKGGEPVGTRRFSSERAYRPASMRRVIAGFTKKAVAQFSSRRAQITKTTLALADQPEKDRRHTPGQRVLASMGRFANAMTRRAKGPGALDFTALLRGWERPSRAAELETPRDLARTIWHATPRASDLTGRVVTQAQNSRGRLGGSRRAGNSRMRRNVRFMAAEPPVWRGRRVACHVDSRGSCNRAHSAKLYASRARLSTDEQLLADAPSEGAPHLAREQAAALLDAGLGQLQTQLHAGVAGD